MSFCDDSAQLVAAQQFAGADAACAGCHCGNISAPPLSLRLLALRWLFPMADRPSLGVDPITLLISYTAADLADATRIYQRTTAMHIIIRLISIVGLLVVAWGLALMAIDWLVLPNQVGDGFGLELLGIDPHCLVWILAALFITSVLSWLRPFRPLAAWLDSKLNPVGSRGPYHVTIDGEGIVARTSNAESRQYWSAFTAVLESKRAFILVYGPWQYAVLPKREFPSAESIEESRELFREQISTYSAFFDR